MTLFQIVQELKQLNERLAALEARLDAQDREKEK